MKLKDLKELANPIYKVKPYVILSKENVVLSAGTLDEILSLNVKYDNYYANCIVKIRKHDLFMNDNTKINKKADNEQSKIST